MFSPTIVYLTGQDTDSYKEEHAFLIHEAARNVFDWRGMRGVGEECSGLYSWKLAPFT